MQILLDATSDTSVKLTIIADQPSLNRVKDQIVHKLGANLKISGFRPGKAPLHVLERSIDQSLLQSEFLERIINDLYVEAIQEERLRPANVPEVAITKFVPFTTLEFTAQVEVVGKLTLPDYKKISLKKSAVTVSAKEVDDVIMNLLSRAATKKLVKRPAKLTDEVVIDFTGTDATTKDKIEGADGADFPLILGSNSFIPGFESELVGLKAGSEKTFVITFPKDYGVATLQNRKVQFVVSVKTVSSMQNPTLDDAFAASVGPFKNMTELKADIKKQLTAEKELQARSEYNNQLLELVASQTTVAIPTSLIEAEIDRIEEEEKRNLLYRGQTWQEHLDAEGIDETAHREKTRTNAELRVKAGLILSEVAEREGLTVSDDELNQQIEAMRRRYTDETMLKELDDPANKRDIASRILSEKTIDRLASFAG
jgi:trigger factor